MNQNNELTAEDGLKKPSSISYAIAILCLGLAVMVGQIFVIIFQTNAGGSLTSLISIALRFFVITMIWQGKNWARIFVVIGLFFNLLGILWWSQLSPQLLSQMQLIVYLDIIHALMIFIAIVLLFLKSSSRWFKAVSEVGF